MTTPSLPAVTETRRQSSPVVTPQALAWMDGKLWLSGRDDHRLVCIDPKTWQVESETATPGTIWAAAPVGNSLYLTVGEGPEDDRYLRRYQPGVGYDENYRIAEPDFTGSYLSHDGKSLYLSQWYKGLVLQLDADGGVAREISVGAEICGHTFVGGKLYVLRGTEKDGESWSIARLDPTQNKPEIEDLARLSFASRSLAFDGENFWTNHRANNETVAFTVPTS